MFNLKVHRQVCVRVIYDLSGADPVILCFFANGPSAVVCWYALGQMYACLEQNKNPISFMFL